MDGLDAVRAYVQTYRIYRVAAAMVSNITSHTFGGFPKLGVPSGGPYNKDYRILHYNGVPPFWETTIWTYWQGSWS